MIVIGAGCSGLSAAFQLKRAGCQVGYDILRSGLTRVWKVVESFGN